MTYTVLSEIQSQETTPAGDQVDVMAVRFQSPEGFVGEVRVPVSPTWSGDAIGYIQQRIAEMEQVAPQKATVLRQVQVQEVGPVGELVDVMQVSFAVTDNDFVSAVRVPIAEGWPSVANDAIDTMAQQMIDVVAGGE